MIKFELNDRIYRWSISMADIYNFAGVDFTDFPDDDVDESELEYYTFLSKEECNVKNIFCSTKTNEKIRNSLRKNIKTHPKYESYTDKYLDQIVGFDFMNYAPVDDNSIEDDVIIIDVGRKVRPEDRPKYFKTCKIYLWKYGKINISRTMKRWRNFITESLKRLLKH